MLTDSEDVTERWREYIEELYAKDEKRTFIPLELEEEVDIDSIGPDLLREGIRQLADWLVLFVCFNLAVASGLFCSGLASESDPSCEPHSPPSPLPPIMTSRIRNKSNTRPQLKSLLTDQRNYGPLVHH